MRFNSLKSVFTVNFYEKGQKAPDRHEDVIMEPTRRLSFLSILPDLTNIRHGLWRHNAAPTSMHRLNVSSTSVRRCSTSRDHISLLYFNKIVI